MKIYPYMNQNIKKLRLGPTMGLIYFKQVSTIMKIAVTNPGIEILSYCDGRRSIEHIVEKISNIYDGDYSDINKIVVEFLETSKKNKMVFYSDTPIESTKIKCVGNCDTHSPIVASINVTDKCPLKCKHCYLDAGQGDVMSDENFDTICKYLIHKHVDTIQLTGGEVFTYKNIFYYINYLLDYNINIFITTSGFFVDSEILHELKKLKGKPINFQISIDGLEKYHNDFRGSNKSFKNAIEFTTTMLKYGFSVSIATCIYKQTYEEILNLCLYLQSIGVKQYRIGGLTDEGRATENLDFDVVENLQYVKSIKNKLCQEFKNTDFIINFIEEQTCEEIVKRSHNCGLGYNMLCFTPNGNVNPCIMSNITIGNMFTDEDIYERIDNFGDIFSKIKAPHNLYCKGCIYDKVCLGCIVKGITYKDKVDNCNWYNLQKDLIDKILLLEYNN